MPDKNITFHLVLSDPEIRSPSVNYTYIYIIHLFRYKGTKAFVQVHKTLETSKEDNVHHYTFMCIVVYSIYFENVEGETLFSVESSRKRSGKASGGVTGPRYWLHGSPPARNSALMEILPGHTHERSFSNRLLRRKVVVWQIELRTLCS